MTGDDGRTSVAGGPPPSTKPGTLHVGTAGFSYPDWAGPVFGGRPGSGPDALATLSRWVDLLEVNVSHYRVPSPQTAEAWLRATRERPGFRFTAKLHRAYTHGPDAPTRAEHRAMRAFLDALGADGRLVGALAQFPPTFHHSPRTLAYVRRLVEHFAGVPLAVEVRDASWDRAEVFDALAAAGATWVVADWTPGPGWIEARTVASPRLGYVRLHGRNPAWYQRGVGRDRRYDHLYPRADLEAFAARVAALRALAASVVVVANNHFGGQAVANALELKAIVEGAPVPGPASLVEAFPSLADVVRPEAPGGTVGPPAGGWFNP